MKKLSYLLFTAFIVIITISGAVDAGTVDVGAIIDVTGAKNNITKNKNQPKQTTAFDQEKVKQIQQIIRDYIINNPEIILDAAKKLQEKEAAEEKAQSEKIKAQTKKIEAAVLKYKNELFSVVATGRTFSGNLNGKVIMAIFTQFHCPHCKVTAPIIDTLLKINPDLEVITIYWPFFGDPAIYAAKTALAAQKQNKFNEVSQALWKSNEFLTKEKVDGIVASIPGIDIKKLHEDMNDKKIETGLSANFKLAQDLGISGAPTSIIINKDDITKIKVISGSQDFYKEVMTSLDEVRR